MCKGGRLGANNNGGSYWDKTLGVDVYDRLKLEHSMYNETHSSISGATGYLC